MPSTGFEDKLLSRLAKLDPDQVQGYLARLLTQKQFLATIFDHLEEGVIVTDEALTVLLVNRRARLMLGWPRGREYVGADLAGLLPADHPLHEPIAALRGRPRAIEGFECAYGPKGVRTLSLSAVPLRGPMLTERAEGDEQDLLILLLGDVTERHKRQAEQARARRLASLANMTSGIAHEIKNPLNSINIHAHLLAEEIDAAERRGRGLEPDKARRVSHVIIEETTRLRRIVEEFIQAARPRQAHLEPRELRPVLESAERIFRPECEQAGVALDVVIEHDLPPLLIDEHLLLQALRNLMRNALEALADRAARARAAGEPFSPRLALEARLAGDHVNLIVADNGPGIAEGALEHIFEPYFTTRFSGSGLGLMVVYRVVTEHNGKLDVDTQPGAGTRFTISLPLEERPVRLLESGEKTTRAPERQAPHEGGRSATTG